MELKPTTYFSKNGIPHKFLRPDSTINLRLRGGVLNEDDKFLAAKRNDVMVCRKCNARLSKGMSNCRKRKCGYSTKMRPKKQLRDAKK